MMHYRIGLRSPHMIRLSLHPVSRVSVMRSVVTKSIEPPLDSTVPERPCTVALIENMGCYSRSWEPKFSQVLPNERGLHFCHVALEITASSTLESVLEGLTNDLDALHNIVLIARGPIWSLVSQYYLESLPLAGLVLVDPTLSAEEKVDKEQSMIQVYMDNLSAKEVESKRAEQLVHGGAQSRPLKLEPGSVPMLMMNSSNEPEFVKGVQDAARRHTPNDDSDSVGIVTTVGLTNLDENEIIDIVCDWIDEKVL